MILICGSHHLALLSQNDPKNKDFNLSSVWVAMPMGSTVPSNILENLKKNLKNLRMIYNVYGMTEISGAVTKVCNII